MPKIVLCFSDEPTGPSRLKLGDILLIARKNDNGEIKIVQELQYLYNDGQGRPVIVPAVYDSLDEYIQEAVDKGKLNVEILAHSASISAHYISPTETKKYPSQKYAIDELTTWLESNILKKNIAQTSISLIVCRAGAESKQFPAIAEQMFALFNEKPLKINARKGFVYVSTNEKIYSLSTFDMMLHKAFISKDTSPATTLDRLSFPVLRGLRTLLNATQIHTYEALFPSPSSWSFYQNLGRSIACRHS